MADSSINPAIIVACFIKGIAKAPRQERRMRDAVRLVLANEIEQVTEHEWLVPSRSTPGKFYRIDWTKQNPCPCPDSDPDHPKHFVSTAAPVAKGETYGLCSHILAIRMIQRNMILDRKVMDAIHQVDEAEFKLKQAKDALTTARAEHYAMVKLGADHMEPEWLEELELDLEPIALVGGS